MRAHAAEIRRGPTQHEDRCIGRFAVPEFPLVGRLPESEVDPPGTPVRIQVLEPEVEQDRTGREASELPVVADLGIVEHVAILVADDEGAGAPRADQQVGAKQSAPREVLERPRIARGPRHTGGREFALPGPLDDRRRVTGKANDVLRPLDPVQFEPPGGLLPQQPDLARQIVALLGTELGEVGLKGLGEFQEVERTPAARQVDETVATPALDLQVAPEDAVGGDAVQVDPVGPGSRIERLGEDSSDEFGVVGHQRIAAEDRYDLQNRTPENPLLRGEDEIPLAERERDDAGETAVAVGHRERRQKSRVTDRAKMIEPLRRLVLRVEVPAGRDERLPVASKLRCIAARERRARHREGAVAGPLGRGPSPTRRARMGFGSHRRAAAL